MGALRSPVSRLCEGGEGRDRGHPIDALSTFYQQSRGALLLIAGLVTTIGSTALAAGLATPCASGSASQGREGVRP